MWITLDMQKNKLNISIMHFFKNKNVNNKGIPIMKHYKYDPLTAV